MGLSCCWPLAPCELPLLPFQGGLLSARPLTAETEGWLKP